MIVQHYFELVYSSFQCREASNLFVFFVSRTHWCKFIAYIISGKQRRVKEQHNRGGGRSNFQIAELIIFFMIVDWALLPTAKFIFLVNLCHVLYVTSRGVTSPISPETRPCRHIRTFKNLFKKNRACYIFQPLVHKNICLLSFLSSMYPAVVAQDILFRFSLYDLDLNCMVNIV